MALAMFEFLKKKSEVVRSQENGKKDSSTGQEFFIEISLELVTDIKDVDKELNRSIAKQYKKHKGVMSILYKYYLLSLEDGSIHENHSIATEVNGYKYIFFSVPFTSKFYFIIYNIDDEANVLDKVKQRVTELSIPPRDIAFNEIKEAVKNVTAGEARKKDAIYIGIIVVTLGTVAIGGYKLFIAKPKGNNMHTMIPPNIARPTAPSKPPSPPSFSPIQEHYALALAEYQCFRDMDNQLQKLHNSGVIVKQISVNTSSTPQSATCTYTLTEDYTYPAVGTKLNGKYYERSNTKTVTITYQDFQAQAKVIPLLIQNANFLKCLSFLKENHFVLQSRPSALQADFVVNADGKTSTVNNTSIDLYKTGQFLYNMEALCGYNINVNNVQISSEGIGGTFVLNWSDNSTAQSPTVAQTTQPVSTQPVDAHASPTEVTSTHVSNPPSQPSQSQPNGMHPINIKVQVVPASKQSQSMTVTK